MTLGTLPRMTPKKIGKMEVWSCLDTTGPTRLPTEMLKDVPDGAADADWLKPYLADDGRLIMAYQSFVIRIDGRVIVVDCAVGEDGNFPPRPDWHERKSNWMSHLGQAGVTVNDVDTVFLTHLHVDHTGWLTRLDAGNWVPTFPNARHLATQTEFDFWSQKHTEFAFMSTSVPDSVKPVADAGLFDFVEPGHDIAPGLTTVDLAGHSPGMVGLEYREGDKFLAAFNADLMHHPIQMAHTGCATMFCSDPAIAISVRQAKLAEYAAEKTIMFNNHFPGECAGHAVADGSGFRFEPIR